MKKLLFAIIFVISSIFATAQNYNNEECVNLLAEKQLKIIDLTTRAIFFLLDDVEKIDSLLQDTQMGDLTRQCGKIARAQAIKRLGIDSAHVLNQLMDAIEDEPNRTKKNEMLLELTERKAMCIVQYARYEAFETWFMAYFNIRNYYRLRADLK